MKLLLVEDSKRLRDSLALGLRKSGYVVDLTGDGAEGYWMATHEQYDVIVLDIMLPNMDGLSILTQLREKQVNTCILMLTARDKVENRVEGLSKGADDYLVKPFAMDELLARIDALCRRSYNIRASHIKWGPVTLDLSKRTVSVNEAELALKPREYRILEYIAMRSGEIVSKSDIESRIYDDNAELRSNVVESAISSIRRKFDAVGHPCPIETRRGLGYLIEKA
ncbi:response regulator transcription factor [Pelagicoccus sp. SDUM812005]|uniref:response regulator transcription factor n=1 Tax=Pelagicoccus sp. SDUM812005 TaxID=3041257 RepID=UPI00280D3E37|nr:response regulator transcription factor [Pelagicoccus sp. SDUM812005]MDQ8179144.1 response regulator transcription factor [Pelagicoccus sp. SDUM812005]